MASIGTRVIAEILRAQNLQQALSYGLRAEHFKDHEEKAIFRFILNYYRTAKDPNSSKVPFYSTVKNRFASFELPPKEIRDQDANHIENLVREIKLSSLESDARGYLSYFQELIEDDVEAAFEAMIHTLPKAYHAHVNQCHGFGVKEILEGMDDARQAQIDGTIYGIPWPWECLNEDTLGKHPGDFIVFYARMKQMKTWLLLLNVINDFQEHNRRVMFWSREMDERKLKLRLASLIGKVDYQLLKNGILPINLWNKARSRIAELVHYLDQEDYEREEKKNNEQRDLLVLSGTTAPKSVGALEDRVNEWKPDIIYVDSFYHLMPKQNENETRYWLRIQYVAEELKQMALDFNIPVVGAAQANRQGEKMFGENMSDMAGADAISREADLVLRVVKKRKDNILDEPEYEGALQESRRLRSILSTFNNNLGIPDLGEKDDEDDEYIRHGAELGIILPGNREGTLEAFKIHAVPGYNFEVISSDFTSDAAREWIEEDDREARKEAQKQKQKQEEKPKKTRSGFSRFTRQGAPK